MDRIDILSSKKIQSIGLPEEYKKYNIINEPLMEVQENTGIIVEMQYPLLNMKNAIKKCFVRKQVLDMLIKANESLPDGMALKIWDAYRPIELQEELFYAYKEILIKEFKLEKLSEQEQLNIIKNYVSLPSTDKENPPLHSTGGAVDVTITNVYTGVDLDLGVPFDSFSSLTASDAYENENINQTIRKNRRILYNTMIEAGFTNLPTEIWHYDYGNRNWAYYKNKSIIYQGIKY